MSPIKVKYRLKSWKIGSHAPGSGLNLTGLEDLSGLRPRPLPIASLPENLLF